MYDTITITQDQALCHLFFHCCLEDQQFSGPEMDDISEKIVELGLQSRIKIGDELVTYQADKKTITDEEEYIRHLIRIIRPVNDLALYSWCVELCLIEPFLDPREESLLHKIGTALDIAPHDQDTLNKLVAQRRSVKIQQVF